MRIAKAATALALTAGALVAGSSIAQADPAGDVSAQGYYYTVQAWHDVNVRTCPSTACAIAADRPFLAAGAISKASCWVHGQEITDAGITNDVWVKLGLGENPPWYVSAVYLTGDEYAGIPFSAVCGA